MHHPVGGGVRLVSTFKRLRSRFFQPEDPHGWADYHSVEQPDGRFWIHTHGLRRWGVPDLEFVDVPHDMRGHAHQLMFAVIERCRAIGVAGPDQSVDGISSAPCQTFGQMATLRSAGHEDKRHRAILRVVDRDRPAEDGFPARLFAAHIAAWAELAQEPEKKEAMCRRALAVFPGNFLEMAAGVELDPRKPDLTDLQYRANLSSYLTLADALFVQRRPAEACGYLEEAIARCPGWGQVQRDYLVGRYRRKDDFMHFWRAADLAGICERRRPENSTGPLPKRKSRGTRSRKAKPAAARHSA